jgi:hypothetical protein
MASQFDPNGASDVPHQLKELLLQSLEHERGGVLLYQTALECAQNDDLRSEWEGYLEQTKGHVTVLTDACRALGLDPGETTPGCQIVQHNGKALANAMRMALAAGNPSAAELVACECIVLAETKDHFDWELIGVVSRHASPEQAEVLTAAYEAVEDEEDEHLYHTKGWLRELWLQSLGLDAVLPPPEESRHVETAMESARVEQERQTS